MVRNNCLAQTRGEAGFEDPGAAAFGTLARAGQFIAAEFEAAFSALGGFNDQLVVRMTRALEQVTQGIQNVFGRFTGLAG